MGEGPRRVHCPWAPNVLAIRHCNVISFSKIEILLSSVDSKSITSSYSTIFGRRHLYFIHVLQVYYLNLVLIKVTLEILDIDH